MKRESERKGNTMKEGEERRRRDEEEKTERYRKTDGDGALIFNQSCINS